MPISLHAIKCACQQLNTKKVTCKQNQSTRTCLAIFFTNLNLGAGIQVFIFNWLVGMSHYRQLSKTKGQNDSISQVVGLPSNSYKPITNMAWVRARLCKLQKGCTRLAAASDKVYQLLAHGRWFSPASSTTKTGRHDIGEILL